MSRADRLLRLVQLLRRYRTPVTAAALASELEVSVRSVYRDVETLRAQGAGIDGSAGLGYVLQPGYLLPPLMFTDEELEALLLGLRLVAEHGDSSLGRTSADVLAKLRAVLPRDLRLLLDHGALLVGPASKRAPEQIDLAEVRRALRLQRKVRIDYAKPNGEHGSRTIWPIALGFFERVRVVVAWCEQRKAFRSFRTDRILSWKALDVPIGRPRSTLLKEFRENENIQPQLGET